MRPVGSLLLLLALCLSAPAMAQGAYEPFDYPPGSNLAGANGGSGYSEPWRVTTGGPTTVVTGAASGEIVAGLTYTDALGQSLPVSGGAWKTSATIQTGQAQRGTLADVGAAGTSVWMSFLVQQAPTTGGTNYAAPTLGTGYASVDPQRMGWGLGILPNANIFYIYTAQSAAVLNIGNAAGKTTFFVVRIDFNANPALDDSVSIWIDPLLNHALPPAPDLRGVGAGRNFPDIVNGLTLLFGENREHVFDEVRIGADLGWTVSEAWVVDNTQNVDSAPLRECTGAPGDCSLRGALARAFDNPGEDEVRFDISMSDPGCVAATGVCTIDNTNGIGYGDHNATRGITIDGYTQPGASPNTLPVGQGTNAQIRIELAGGGFGFAAPFTVRGLAFLGPGLSAARADGVLNPAVPQQGNPRYQIHGNFFGFRADGLTATVVSGQQQFLTMDLFRGEIRGIEIGGPDPAQMNVFGGTGTTFCIQLRGNGHRVHGNLIGTDRSGMVAHSCGFQAGIQVQDFAFPSLATDPAAPHLIGGPDPGEGNVISGHRGHAIANDSGAPQGLVIVQGNRIGVAVDGQTPLPNITYPDIFPVPTGAIRGDGRATSMQIVDNLFGPNGLTRGRTPATPPFVQTPALGNDVGVWESRGNRYRGLQGLALDVVRNVSDIPPRTPNDAGDADAQGLPAFGNRVQNFPEISAFSQTGAEITLSYRVDSQPANSAYPLNVEFYRDNGRGDLDPIGSDTYLEAEAQQVKQIVLTLPPGITLGAGDVVVGMASTSTVAPNRSGETSETTFYPLESFSFVSLTPATVPAGVPYTARVRVVAAPGAPFKPNGRVLIFDGRGSECVAFIEAVAAERTGEGECQLVTTGAPANVTVSASYSASQNAFATAAGGHPGNVSQVLTLTPGVTTLELVAGDSQSAPVGEAFAEPLQVRATGDGSAPIAGVQIRFEGPAVGPGASFNPVTATTQVDGLASTTATAIRAGGSYTVSARVGALTQTFNLSNAPGFDTALAIVSHLPNPSNPGQAVTVSTALNPEAGGPAPTGAIAVTANSGEACSIVLPATSCALTFATLGAREIQAFYPGDASYFGSKAAFTTQTVQLPPALRIDNVSQNEGNSGSGTMSFSVTLDNPLGSAVSVNYATANNTATTPGDYLAASGTLDFAGTTTTQTIEVTINGDTEIEADEQFFVNLSAANGATIADGQGVGIILNDDQPPPPAASINDVMVQEPVSSGLTEVLARFTVSLDRPATAPATVRVRTQNGTAVAPADYDANDFVLEFAAGDQALTVDILVSDDEIAEGTETFTVQLSEPQGLTIADGAGSGTILDGGPNANIIVTSSADPGDGSCTPSECTLREAITLGNAFESIRIGFDIPGTGPHTIRPLTPLPLLGRPIHTIDGYTQPGSVRTTARTGVALDNVIQIALDGGALGGTVHGLDLVHGASVSGLAIHNWSGAGIRITTSAEGRPTNITGNYLGTDASGQVARGNLVGIELRPNASVAGSTLSWVIGGPVAARNLISGNRAHGVMIVGGVTGPAQGRIAENLIGLARDGAPLGNGAYGLSISTPSSNRVHAFSTSSNYIGSNAGGGIQIISPEISPDALNLPLIRFVNDQIGTADGEPRPNLGHAISIGEGPSSVAKVHFLSVAIDHEAGPAVRILGAQTEVIVNALRLPAGSVPIDIGPAGATPNDPGDADNGPNRLLNTPTLLSAQFNDRGDRLRVSYQVDTPQDAGVIVQFYRRIDERLEFVGEQRYPGGMATAEFETSSRFLTGRLAAGSEIVAQTVLMGIASSELTPTPIVLEGRQALASSAPTREGNAVVARFVIGLDEPVISATTLNYRTIDGSATAGADYQARSGSVTLTPAAPTANVDVPLINDALVEPDENFDLEVFSPTNFGIGSALTTATIVDDDRLRQDRGQYDAFDLDSLNGVEGFRLEHPRMPETSLIDLGNFNGTPATDLLLAQATNSSHSGNPSSLYLLPDLTAPFQASYEIPANGSTQFPRIVDDQARGAGYLPIAAGRMLINSLTSMVLRNGDRTVAVHGRTTPLAASNNLSTLSSTVTITGTSFRVTLLGDINGDGRMDFAVESSASGAISTAVVFGPSNGQLPGNLNALNGSNGFTITNRILPQHGVIFAVRSIGDINNDGRADLLVRGSAVAGGPRDALILGQTSFPSQVFFDDLGAVPIARLTELETASGDFNGDGHGDVVFATPKGAISATRSVFIVFGNGTLAGIGNANSRTEIRQAFPSDGLGTGLAVMDLDGNGIADLALGAAGADQPGTRAGRVAVLYGRTTWPTLIDLSSPPPQTVKFLSTRAGAGVGYRLAAISDLNGDGRGELAIAAPTVGRSYVYFSNDGMFSAGGESAPPLPPVRQVYSSRDGSPGETRITAPHEVLPVGDVDGDGKPDVLFGVPEALACAKGESCGTRTGAELLLPGAVLNAHVSIGPSTPPSGTTRIRRADKPNEPLTGKYAGVGDFNGDGRADLAFLSAAGGFVAVVAGRATLPAFLDPQADALARSRRFALDATDGLRVAGLGDIDGDGFADLGVLRGAPSARRIEIIYGIASGTPRRTQITAPAGLQPITLARTPRLGRIRTGAVPADSFEVILGEGRRAVVFGAAALPPTLDLGNLAGAGMYLTAAHRLPANAATLAALGDIDGDGIADFGVAHSPVAIDGSAQGRIEILRGRASWPASLDVGTSDPALIAGRIVLRGEGVGSINGLDAMRDRNADGRRELLISLGLAEGHATQSGKAFIVHGPALPAGQQTVIEFDDEVPAGMGVTLRYGRFEGGNWAILRTLGDIDGDGKDDFAFGADANDGVDGLVRSGNAGVLRGSALPP